MSIDFNGTTSKLEHTTATGYGVSVFTILVWAWADSRGGGNLGRIFAASEVGTSHGQTEGFFVGHNGVADNSLHFRAASNAGNDGEWTFPATDAQWNAIGLSFDGTNSANDPVARVNFASATVTDSVVPGGTIIPALSGYCIGNNTAQARTWDGALQHLQFFNVILTAQEMDGALRVPGSIRRGLVSWWPMWHSGYTVDLVNTGFQPTATALTTRDGAPGSMPWGFKRQGWRGNFTAAAPAADALGAMTRRLGWGGILQTGIVGTA